MMKLYNLTRGTLVAGRVKIADRFFTRLRGLTFYNSFPGDFDALVISPCNAVHTFFMRFAIDVIFVDRELNVIQCLEKMERGKVSPVVKGAVYAVEVPAGVVAASKTEAGHRLSLGKMG